MGNPVDQLRTKYPVELKDNSTKSFHKKHRLSECIPEVVFWCCGNLSDCNCCAVLQVRQVLIRHPEHFYISKKGARNTVFLREAFEGVHVPGQRQEHILKDKHPLVLVKEKLAVLMAVKQVSTVPESTVSLQENIEPFENCEVSVQDANSRTPEMVTAVSA
jgi:hypothetical protein